MKRQRHIQAYLHQTTTTTCACTTQYRRQTDATSDRIGIAQIENQIHGFKVLTVIAMESNRVVFGSDIQTIDIVVAAEQFFQALLQMLITNVRIKMGNGRLAESVISTATHTLVKFNAMPPIALFLTDSCCTPETQQSVPADQSSSVRPDSV